MRPFPRSAVSVSCVLSLMAVLSGCPPPSSEEVAGAAMRPPKPRPAPPPPVAPQRPVARVALEALRCAGTGDVVCGQATVNRIGPTGQPIGDYAAAAQVSVARLATLPAVVDDAVLSAVVAVRADVDADGRFEVAVPPPGAQALVLCLVGLRGVEAATRRDVCRVVKTGGPLALSAHAVSRPFSITWTASDPTRLVPIGAPLPRP